MIPPAMALRVNPAIVLTPSFCLMFSLWNETVLTEMFRIAAISLLDRPSAMRCSTSRSRELSLRAFAI